MVVISDSKEAVSALVQLDEVYKRIRNREYDIPARDAFYGQTRQDLLELGTELENSITDYFTSTGRDPSRLISLAKQGKLCPLVSDKILEQRARQ